MHVPQVLETSIQDIQEPVISAPRRLITHYPLLLCFMQSPAILTGALRIKHARNMFIVTTSYESALHGTVFSGGCVQPQTRSMCLTRVYRH